MIPVLGSQPAGDVSHKPGGRLPLLSNVTAAFCIPLKTRNKIWTASLFHFRFFSISTDGRWNWMFRPSRCIRPVPDNANRGPWQLFAQARLLTRDKDLSQPASRVDTLRHAGNYFVPLSVRPIIIFFVAEVMSNYLTGWKNFSLLPEAPLRPEARGICHICHTVNPASRAWSSASRRSIFNSWYLLQRGLRTHTVYQGWKKSWLKKI